MLKDAQIKNPSSVEIMIRLGTIAYVYEKQLNSLKEA
jgi:hypothetical protein